jgi:hypothetical protein
MKIEQCIWTSAKNWEPELPGKLGATASLVILFGSTLIFEDQTVIQQVRAIYPSAQLIGCSTAGEIFGEQSFDESLVVTAVQFEKTVIKTAVINFSDVGNSYLAGQQIADSFNKTGLRHLFILSDGLKVNGTELVNGLINHLPSEVTITGGLSGDGERFLKTYVLHNQNIEKGLISAIGFYGNDLEIGYGSYGGWEPFGPERLITRSKGNILYEMDGKSALAIYKQYLGDYAKELPASALLFPLNIWTKENENGLVRTILSVNEEEQSMTFAGDMPEGAYCRLMKSNYNKLIDGAIHAAKTTTQSIQKKEPDLAILISCVGRKLILKNRTDEEIEGVKEILGQNTVITGFYSYGEISPFGLGKKCELHNQTMTITTFSEL